MKRLNVLIISGEKAITSTAFRVLSRVFRNHFILEAESRADAERLLKKLQIDMVLVDFDSCPSDLNDFQSMAPNAKIAAVGTGNGTINPSLHRLYNRSELFNELLADLKEVKKGISASSPSSSPALLPSADFRNFSKLTAEVSAE